MQTKLIQQSEKLQPKQAAQPALKERLRKNILNHLVKNNFLAGEVEGSTKNISAGLHQVLLCTELQEAHLLLQWLEQLLSLADVEDKELNYYAHHLAQRVEQQQHLAKPFMEALLSNLAEIKAQLPQETKNKAILKRKERLTEVVGLLQSDKFIQQRQGLLKLSVILPAYTYGGQKNLTAYATLKNIYASIDHELSLQMERTLVAYYKHSLKKITTALRKLDLSTLSIFDQRLQKLLPRYQALIRGLRNEVLTLPATKEAVLVFAQKCQCLLLDPKVQYILEDSPRLEELTQEVKTFCGNIQLSLGATTYFQNLQQLAAHSFIPRNFDIVELFSKISVFLPAGRHSFTLISEPKKHQLILYIDHKKYPRLLLSLWGFTRKMQDTLGSLVLDLENQNSGILHIEKLSLARQVKRVFFLVKT